MISNAVVIVWPVTADYAASLILNFLYMYIFHFLGRLPKVDLII